MFWWILLAALVLFLVWVAWAGRRRGTGRVAPNATALRRKAQLPPVLPPDGKGGRPDGHSH
jgi:hypothetical protein